jgi:pyruvate-formate lyase-activating enzyme
MPKQKKPTVKIDLTDTDSIKNVLVKADEKNRQYMIISNLEVWENIKILAKAINASMTYLVNQGEGKKEVLDKVAQFFIEDDYYKVEKTDESKIQTS